MPIKEIVLGEEQIANKKCFRHPLYRGYRQPRLGCEICAAIFEYNRKTGIREHRKSRKIQTQEVA